MSNEQNNDAKKSRARKTTPTYNANGIKAPRYNVKGLGKMAWSLGGLKGAQVSPSAARGRSEGQLAKSIGGALTGLNCANGKRHKG